MLHLYYNTYCIKQLNQHFNILRMFGFDPIVEPVFKCTQKALR